MAYTKHWDVQFVREEDFPHVLFRAAVVEDAASAKNQKIDVAQLRCHLLSGERSGRDRALDVVTCQCIGRVS